MKRAKLPVAMTVAGSDSGGGAGVQADLKTFAALGTHGVSVITSITAQNPRGVTAVEACSVKIIDEQLRAVAAFRPAAAKTGMLFSAEIIVAVAAFFRAHKNIKLIVDPVMIATSGARLLRPDAIQSLRRELLPLATLVTPNTAEAEALTGLRVREPEDLRTVARALHREFGCAALVKGGHLNTRTVAIDVFFDGQSELLLEAPRAVRVATHGTGCTYAAAITAEISRGKTLSDAVTDAKEFITGAIYGSMTAGPFTVLNPFF
ncbi:MAG TPA: bifunctional hydroxymethylpyrimidine kinase/phosphomethylpyrimidine kinase [Candidatus Acidoferrum sp.]|nr:bifunctional hydroxymethylpyrimidine kinase/phosphomethylpyrimidine kinase [Candidatus Acidoferrum sp.]